MGTGYVGFGGDTLSRLPRARPGDRIACRRCGDGHELRAAENEEGKPDETSLYYVCSGKSYLAAVGGRLVDGLKPDVSGEVDL